MENIFRVKVSLADVDDVEIAIEAEIKLGTTTPYLVFYQVGDMSVHSNTVPSLLSEIFGAANWYSYEISEVE